MINRIIGEIEKCLEQENYIAALSMALILPDICGKADRPTENTGVRYKKWYKENVLREKSSDPYGTDMPYLSEEVIYQLRNSMLHQGTPNVNAASIKEERCKIDQFVLFVDDPYRSGLSTISYGKEWKIVNRKLEINLILTCTQICRAAKKYYENYIERFDFFNYSFEDRKKSREEYKRELDLLQDERKE